MLSEHRRRVLRNQRGSVSTSDVFPNVRIDSEQGCDGADEPSYQLRSPIGRRNQEKAEETNRRVRAVSRGPDAAVVVEPLRGVHSATNQEAGEEERGIHQACNGKQVQRGVE